MKTQINFQEKEITSYNEVKKTWETCSFSEAGITGETYEEIREEFAERGEDVEFLPIIIRRQLSNGAVLTVVANYENNTYFARVSSDTANHGFDGDSGEIKAGETIEIIADQIECWCEDNINN